jgi:hypothetical protein
MKRMDERAALYMVGPPETVMNDSFTDGPTPYSLDLINVMQDGDVLVGKRQNGTVVFREQLVDGKLTPWSG